MPPSSSVAFVLVIALVIAVMAVVVMVVVPPLVLVGRKTDVRLRGLTTAAVERTAAGIDPVVGQSRCE